MNAMVQDMSWDLAARQEGSEITALPTRVVEGVSGGHWWYEAATIAAGFATGFGVGYLTRKRNK